MGISDIFKLGERSKTEKPLLFKHVGYNCDYIEVEMREIIQAYLKTLEFKPPTTKRTYTQGIKTYVKGVGVNAPISLETYIKFLKHLNPYPMSTQRTYRSAVMDLYSFYCDEYHKTINMLAMKRADKRYLKRGKKRFHFDRGDINTLLDYSEKLHGGLIDLRDKAFIIFMVDSGARISEACALKRGDVPWKDKTLFIVGKGDKEEKIHFSDRALVAIKKYLDRRAKLDGGSGSPLESLPLFARHDPGAGNKIKPIHPGGMWYSFTIHAAKAGIKKGSISPHKLRHEAITRYYETTRDIKRTKEFSRHSNIEMVDRYTHLIDTEVDDGYNKTFNE